MAQRAADCCAIQKLIYYSGMPSRKGPKRKEWNCFAIHSIQPFLEYSFNIVLMPFIYQSFSNIFHTIQYILTLVNIHPSSSFSPDVFLYASRLFVGDTQFANWIVGWNMEWTFPRQ